MEQKAPVAQAQTQQFLGAFDLFKPSLAGILLNIKTFLTLIAVGIAPFVLAVPLFFISSAVDSEAVEIAVGIIGGLAAIAGLALLLMTGPGLFVTQLSSVRGHVIAPKTAFKQGLKHFWRFYGTTILQNIIFFVSLIALIVPYFFALRRYTLAQYYVIDKNMGVMEALRTSANDSITYKSPMWGLVGVLILLSIAGAIPYVSVVAIVPTVMYTLAPAVRYSEIQTANQAQEDESDIASVIAKPVV